MRAGTLRHRVTIEQAVIAQNDYGEPIRVWAIVRQVWASIEPLRGREYIEAKTMQAEVDHRIRMRYQADLTPSHRIRYGERVFEIESVIHVGEARVETQAMCREATK